MVSIVAPRGSSVTGVTSRRKSRPSSVAARWYRPKRSDAFDPASVSPTFTTAPFALRRT